jgi:hypothetical protein
MNLPPPLQDNDPIITQFRPVIGQWELNDDNIKRIDPETGETILHNYYAHVNTTPLEVYRYLIEVKGCDVNAQDNNKDTPFHKALEYFEPRNGGDITVLHYLLSQEGFNRDIKGWNGYTILHTACININYLPLDSFKVLIETRGFDVNAQGDDNDTPVHLAFRAFNPHHGGDITVLAYLINQKNLNVNITNRNDHTLLHLACICQIAYYDDVYYDPTEYESADYESADFDDGREAKSDTILCHIVQTIAERYVQQVLDETTS